MRNRIAFIFSVAVCFAVSPAIFAQKNDYGFEAKKLYTYIQLHYYDSSTHLYKEIEGHEERGKSYTYLWPVTCLLQASDEIEKLDPATDYFNHDWQSVMQYQDSWPPAVGYSSYITNEHDKRLPGAKSSRFYDDNQWIGIAALDAYERKKDPGYLEMGKRIYRFMMTGFDTTTNGGLYWQEDNKTSKNACSNGPGILVALQLYKITQNKNYLDTALMLYNWMNKTLKAPTGLYYDNIHVQTKKVETWLFSYNTGSMLQANVYLYEATKNKTYLNTAIAIADSSVKYFCDKSFRDNIWFEAVLLRGYQQLLKHCSDLKYIKAFKYCTDQVLLNNVNKDGLAGKEKPFDMVQQAGFIEILARLSFIETKYAL
jgi:rhamnogalacturonyl hydrolase YesR